MFLKRQTVICHNVIANLHKKSLIPQILSIFEPKVGYSNKRTGNIERFNIFTASTNL